MKQAATRQRPNTIQIQDAHCDIKKFKQTIYFFSPPQHTSVLTDGSPREDSIPSPDTPAF
uniref:Uncharacterized protein n=1 Tax=Oryza meridionalis TaxID=40149 RepID=A0A0E0CCG4_9ORYZ